MRSELLHLAVNNRKNEFVRSVLKILCLTPLDTTDGSSDEQISDDGKKMVEKAVLFATLNDDPDTLEEILKFLVLVFQLLLKVVLEEDGGKLMFLQLVDLVAVDQVVVMVDQEHLVKEMMEVLVKEVSLVLT